MPLACLDEPTFMDLLLGTLPSDRAALVDEHLDTCPSCRRMVSEALKVQPPTDSGLAVPEEEVLDSQLATLAVDPWRGKKPRLRLPTPPLARGTAVGRYLILEMLGVGGMSVVYAAYDPELDRRVALKLLQVEALGLGAEAGRTQVLREAQAMARVSHPHVVSVFDVGTFGRQVFLAMELVDAHTLRKWEHDGPHPWRQVVEVFLAVARGLAAAHAVGVVHGDVKPENILVAQDGRVRVTDFGLSRIMFGAVVPPVLPGSPTHPRAMEGGTPAYMAPEQFPPEERTDARSDQFGFCAALYEGLYGERPFAGATVEELSQAVHAGRVKSVPRHSGVPQWLRKVVVKGLSVKPEDRHASMEALIAALDADPAARRTWRLRVAGASLLLLSAVGLAHVLNRRDVTGCEGAARAMDGVWDASRQQAVEAAFVGTERRFANDAFRHVRRGLDSYTAAWVTTRTAACEATRVRHEQSEAVMALRMRCLDARLADVAALTQLFTQADPDLVERAPRAVEGLTPLAGCSDVEALTSRGHSSSDDPAARDRTVALLQALVDARALRAAGRYSQGVARVEPVAQSARAAGDWSGAADALLLLAELKDGAGDYRGAEATVLQAAWTAEAGRNDDAAARAWTLAVRVTGERLDHYAQGQQAAERASAAVERLGASRELAGALAVNLGRLLSRQGRYPEAHEQLTRALSFLEKRFGPEALEVADVRVELGTVRRSQGRAEEALGLYERALGTVRGALGPEHPDVARIRLEQASVRWQQGDFVQSERLARGALALLERSLGQDHPQVADALNSLALALQYQGKREEALPLYERALSIAEKTEGRDSSTVAIIVNNIGTLLVHMGRLEEATQRFATALEQVEKSLGPDHPTLALVLRGMGQTLSYRNQPDQALPYFQRAAALQTSLPDDVNGGWTGALVDLGRTYMVLGRPREALAPLEQAVAGWERARPRPAERPAARYMLARALWDAKQDPARAVRLAAEARQEAAALPDEESSVPELRQAMDRWIAKLPPAARKDIKAAMATPKPADPARDALVR
ncbi:tetratricopeptide repeat protein [Corallococcus exiguus]|uniref:tetratricopeptide repeat protein n=1 Tax=Corallococcus exiguus TaxID=83462 RepID=UPI001475DAD0|nr:tetratricopeptide repeat protein [Corallococcus exiguus]NNB99030.1 tetratricopeptide repeat protein [Corallococcus exiguus]